MERGRIVVKIGRSQRKCRDVKHNRPWAVTSQLSYMVLQRSVVRSAILRLSNNGQMKNAVLLLGNQQRTTR